MSAGMMFVLWKGVLGFGLPIALGIWELYRLRKYRDEDAGQARPPFEPEPAPPAPVAQPIVARRTAAKVPELV